MHAITMSCADTTWKIRDEPYTVYLDWSSMHSRRFVEGSEGMGATIEAALTVLSGLNISD